MGRNRKVITTNGLKSSHTRTNGHTYQLGSKPITSSIGLTNSNGLSDNAFSLIRNKPKLEISNQGLKDSNGFTNGNGLTDGNGLTNGNGLTLTKKTSHNIDHKLSIISNLNRQYLRNKVFTLILAISLILLPLLIYTIDIPSKVSDNEVYIDNEFNDWDSEELISDEYSDQVNNPNINIVRYHLKESSKGFSFFVEVDGNIFNGISENQNHYPDSVSILVDSDSDLDTGYRSNGLGADLMIDLRGYNSDIVQNHLYFYNSDSVEMQDHLEWNNWEYMSNVNIGTDSCRLEGEVTIPSHLIQKDLKAQIITKDHFGNLDKSDNIISPDLEIVAVSVASQPPEIIFEDKNDIEFLSIEPIRKTNGDRSIFINELMLTKLGTAPTKTIKNIRLALIEDSNDPEQSDINSGTQKYGQPEPTTTMTIGALGNNLGNGNERTMLENNPSGGSYVEFEPDNSIYDPQPFNYKIIESNIIIDEDEIQVELLEPIEVKSEEQKMIKVLLDVSAEVEYESTLGLKLENINIRDSIATINHLYLELAYLGSKPDRIVIDGAFSDWSSVSKIADTDDMIISNPDVDCQQYSIDMDENNLNFYFEVSGELLSTNELPIKLIQLNIIKNQKPDNVELEIDPKDIVQIPKKFIAKDTLRIFLDTDQNLTTGFKSTWLPIGAEYMIEITGHEGKIYEKHLFKYNSKLMINDTWSWEYISDIAAAKDQTRLETALKLDHIDFEPNAGCDIFYIISNWDNSIADTSELIITTLNQGSDLLSKDTIKPQPLTRSNNPYTSDYIHPINSSDNDGGTLDILKLDENAPGDGVYEKTGRDTDYAWIECGFKPQNIPENSVINNLTIYMGYKNDNNWNLNSSHKGLIWKASNISTEHDIADYTISTGDRDDYFILSTDLPSAEELNQGIYIRASGRDPDGSPWDYFYLDYLYFTVNYSISNIVINEIMFDPSGNDNNSEWVELFNAAESAINLSGWSIENKDGNKIMLTNAGNLAAGEYLICHIAQNGINSSSDLYASIYNRITIQPGSNVGKDNYLDSSNTKTNQGSQTFIKLENTSSMKRPIIQFNISSFPSNGILNAEVSLFRYTGNSNIITADVNRVTSNWFESSSDWDTYDGTNDWPVNDDGGDFDINSEDSILICGDLNKWYSWDITDLVKSWKNGTYENYGIIFNAQSNSWLHQFYSSDYTTDSSKRPKLVVDFINHSMNQMLNNSDSLFLLDDDNNVVDYVAWGSDPGTADDSAVSMNQWTEGAFVNTSNLLENETLARNKDSKDTDTTADWENSTTAKAAPYGINATASTPGGQNLYPEIPEFEVLAIPIFIITFIYFCINRNQNDNHNHSLRKRKSKRKSNNSI